MASLETDDVEAIACSLSTPEVFSVVFDHHFDTVYRYVARRLGAGSVAEDITAETFAVAFAKRFSFDPVRGRFSSWLLGIATNLLRHHYRSETRRLAATTRLSTELTAAVVPDDQDGQHASELAGRLGAGLAALPAAQRDVISLVDGAGLTYEEAASALSIPLGTVRSRLFRARATVRSYLQPTIRGSAGAERRGQQ